MHIRWWKWSTFKREVKFRTENTEHNNNSPIHLRSSPAPFLSHSLYLSLTICPLLLRVLYMVGTARVLSVFICTYTRSKQTVYIWHTLLWAFVIFVTSFSLISLTHHRSNGSVWIRIASSQQQQLSPFSTPRQHFTQRTHFQTTTNVFWT